MAGPPRCSFSAGPRAVFGTCAALCALACSDGKLVVLGRREPTPYRFDKPELVSELSGSMRTDNPTLTEDMLEIFFTSDRDGILADIYVAERSARAERFGAVRRVDALSG